MSTANEATTIAVQRWKFSVADYHRMWEKGMFPEDVRVELIDGDLRTIRLLEPHRAAIEQYAQPVNGRYPRIHILQHGDTRSAQTRALEVSIDALFGV